MALADNKWLNIQQQVLKNKNDIKAIVEAGKISFDPDGHVATEAELPEGATYQGSYGDIYAVGTEAPYDYYVFTRPGEDMEYPYWFNLGKIQLVGPQGPQGERGPQGETGTRGSLWRFGTVNPAVLSTDRTGDKYLRTDNGDLFTYNGSNWSRIGCIMGPTGIQGPKGDKGERGEQGPKGEKGATGDPGNFVHIAAKLASADLLPDPATLNDTSVAYLVGTDRTTNILYMQIGSSPATASWYNLGALNIATYVTVGGEFVNAYEMDAKLDKQTAESGEYAYVYGERGQGGRSVMESAQGSTIAKRTSLGTLAAQPYKAGPMDGSRLYGNVVSTLDQFPAVEQFDFESISGGVSSNAMTIGTVDQGDHICLSFRVNPNGDLAPMWFIQFQYTDTLSVEWDEIECSNAIHWIGGVKPTFETGKHYTLMFWPSATTGLNVSAGSQYEGELIGVWNEAE